MNNKELTKLALKIFSIYIMVHATLSIPQFFQAYIMIFNGSEYSSHIWIIIVGTASILLLTTLSVFIWKLSANITSQVSHESNIPPSTLSEGFALSILGLYLSIYGMSKLATGSASAYYLIADNSDVNYNITQSIIYLAVYFFIVIVGVSLMIKSNGWSKLLNKLRVKGTQ